MSDPLDLDHLEHLAKNATPGPWRRDLNYKVKTRGDAVTWSGYALGPETTESGAYADAAFIAAARDAVPALIAEVRRLREEREDRSSSASVALLMLKAHGAEADMSDIQSYLEVAAGGTFFWSDEDHQWLWRDAQ